MTKKQTYLAPAIKVVSFSIEKGFAGTSGTEQLHNGSAINMGGSTNPAPSGSGFFNRNNETQAIDGLF